MHGWDRKLQDFVDSLYDAVLLVDRDGRIRCGNRGVERIFGYPTDQLLGQPVDVLVPAQLRSAHESLREAFTQRPVERLVGRKHPVQARRKDGSEIPVDIDLVPYQDAPGWTIAIIKDASARRQAEAALRASEQMFRQLAENISEVFWLITPDWREVLYVSPAYETLWQRPCQSLYDNPESWIDALHPDDRAAVLGYLADKQAGNLDVIDFPEYRVVRPNGSIRWVRSRGFPVDNDQGQIYRIAGVATDITDLKEADTELRRSEALLSEAQSIAHLGSWELNLQTGKAVWSNEELDLLGLAAAETEGSYERFRASLHPDDREWVLREMQRAINGEVDLFIAEHRVQRSDGSIRYVVERGRVFFGEDGTPLRMIGTTLDISERKQFENHIRQLADYDSLTQLPNRNLFYDRCSHAIARARREGSRIALLFLDLDHFKNINDSLGHPAGDALLVMVAKALLSERRENDTVARLGGDEFTILIEDVADLNAVGNVAARLLRLFESPFHIAPHQLSITTSIGIALYPDDGADVTSLVSSADAAMYHAKSAGRNNYQFYTPELTSKALDRMRLESALRKAIDTEAFSVHYQPQFSMTTGELVGMEALLRWNDPDSGPIAPDRFIPVAEDTGLIIPIGAWVLRTACAQARQWLDAGLTFQWVAVNLSAIQIQQSNMVETISRVLHETGLPARFLELELTETSVMSRTGPAIGILEQIKELGVGLVVDDFGTGYSSLSHLKRLPIRRLKIDRSFIRDIPGALDDVAIVSAILALAESLQLTVVAEGVENDQQRAFLAAKGCHHVQGWLYSPAVPADELLDTVRRLSGNINPSQG
jgi:diguanylate cyclase (GGDEF)-like protein/PAS domain S-box-containing protein